MSITNELREESRGIQTFTCMTEQAEELLAIADRIDAEHEAACAEAYGNGVQSVALPDMTAYVKLPVDAEGVPIHVGDVMDGNRGTVTCIRDAGHGWEIVTDHMYSYNPADLHHHAPIVEDVLREFAEKVIDSQIPSSHPTYEEAITEYAAKLRLVDDRKEQ